MPAPPLHMTFGEMVADAPAAPKKVREAVRKWPTYARLGSLYHDLPYFSGLVHLCIEYWRGAQGEYADWGVKLHRERPGSFSEHVVRYMRAQDGPLERSQRLAFVAGFLSHAIIDHTLHPLVNHTARRVVDRKGGRIHHQHVMVEKQHSIFFHLERFGDDVLGSGIMRDRMQITPSGGVEMPLARFLTEMMTSFFGSGPKAEEFAAWARCWRQVSFLLSTYPALRNSRKHRTQELRELYYSNEEFDFRDFFAAADERTNKFLVFAYDYFEAAEFTQKAHDAFVAEVALDDLVFPDPLRHPEKRVSQLRRSA